MALLYIDLSIYDILLSAEKSCQSYGMEADVTLKRVVAELLKKRMRAVPSGSGRTSGFQ